MKCPVCLHTMMCISEIHDVPGQPGRQRMDLHYVKPIGDNRRGCANGGFMGVITEDPKEWVCHEYRFPLYHNGRGYLLRGYNRAVDLVHQTFFRNPNDAVTFLQTPGGVNMVTLPYFIPISTGDDMHERAWELFYRLRNLVIYS
jgi:hypothetical protein